MPLKTFDVQAIKLLVHAQQLNICALFDSIDSGGTISHEPMFGSLAMTLHAKSFTGIYCQFF
jgi:hypothetical protein